MAFDMGTLKPLGGLRRQEALSPSADVSQAAQDRSRVCKETCRARFEAGVNCLHVYWDYVDFLQLKILS